ncbi:hypothetical protein C8R47DRAFT_1215647 [Mycena vitilis]|nr:hypothetical protein C8R47DRAFT_1229791 [Mycena vitilis]KAJ6489297.1 hypothetical protein C8R47DRAFT_1215647 [Mycena vitilis]
MPADSHTTVGPYRQASDVVLSRPAIVANKCAATPKQNAKKAGLREGPTTRNSVEIIEISSDEEEEPVVLREMVTTSRLQERIRKLERVCTTFLPLSPATVQFPLLISYMPQENACLKNDSAEIKKQQAKYIDLEHYITCEVCTSKMWNPYILPDCGHTFCKQDLIKWFDTILTQHRERNSNEERPLPPYTCPTCRERVRSKPIENFAVKNFVRVVAAKAGESSPKKPVTNSATVWGRFFPQ